jgi:hypothetical protein
VSDEDRVCSICQADFSIENEGGQEGFIGMIPVAFCPYCVTGIIEFAEQLTEEWT